MSVRRVGKRWQVRVRIGSGQRVERTLPRTATHADARALETQILRAQVDAAIGRPPKYLIDQALDRWAESAKSLKSWARDLRYRADVIRSYTNGHSLEAIPEIAERIKEDGQREKLTPASINRYVSILRRVGNLAEMRGGTARPTGRGEAMLPERSERHVYLTPAEVERLARKADPLTGDMIRFAALSGLRKGEMLGLRPEQVQDGLLLLDAGTKSGRPRGVPLPPQAVAIARKRLPWGLRRDALRQRFLKARTAAGMGSVRWHDLRHTYASWLVQAGQPLTAVRDLLGHSSLAVTNRYAHLAPAHLREAVGALPGLGKLGNKFPKKKS